MWIVGDIHPGGPCIGNPLIGVEGLYSAFIVFLDQQIANEAVMVVFGPMRPSHHGFIEPTSDFRGWSSSCLVNAPARECVFGDIYWGRGEGLRRIFTHSRGHTTSDTVFKFMTMRAEGRRGVPSREGERRASG